MCVDVCTCFYVCVRACLYMRVIVYVGVCVCLVVRIYIYVYVCVGHDNRQNRALQKLLDRSGTKKQDVKLVLWMLGIVAAQQTALRLSHHRHLEWRDRKLAVEKFIIHTKF